MKVFAWFILSVLLFSCSQFTKNDVPPGVLSESKMVNVLVDVHLAEARANVTTAHLDSAKLYFRIYKDSIFKKHHMTHSEFDSSYNFYMKNITRMDKIYMAVVDSLSLRQGLKKLN
ncbi:MAG: DUF4296 domain-containing protein [Cytophagales bacterium]|nr:DUF4296 domain-containing protein [Cytophagales bacterium]